MSPRNNNVFGMVHISKSKNSKIIDTTSREGVIFNQEFEDLREFVKQFTCNLFVKLRSEKESFKVKAKKSKAKVKKESKKTEIPKTIVLSNSFSLPEKESFINVKGEYPQNFYLSLEEEINGCYDKGFPNAAFLLSRKMIENLIYDILQNKFTKETEKYWIKKEGINQPKSLFALITSLENFKKEFTSNTKRYIEEVLPLLKKFRSDINPVAHNIYNYIENLKKLEEYKINDCLQFLLNIWRNISK